MGAGSLVAIHLRTFTVPSLSPSAIALPSPLRPSPFSRTPLHEIDGSPRARLSRRVRRPRATTTSDPTEAPRANAGRDAARRGCGSGAAGEHDRGEDGEAATHRRL